MSQPVAAIIGAAVLGVLIAGAILLVNHWAFSPSGGAVLRLNHWTGAIDWCEIPPDKRPVRVRCE